jgi:hypothetical protein
MRNQKLIFAIYPSIDSAPPSLPERLRDVDIHDPDTMWDQSAVSAVAVGGGSPANQVRAGADCPENRTQMEPFVRDLRIIILLRVKQEYKVTCLLTR